MTSNDRIQRINAAFEKRREESRRLTRGLAFKAGRHWAMTDDHVTQLGRLEKLRDPNDGSLADKFVPRGNDRRDALTMFIEFALLLHPAWKKANDWVAVELWRHELQDSVGFRVTTPWFMQSFAEGALSVLDERRSAATKEL